MNVLRGERCAGLATIASLLAALAGCSHVPIVGEIDTRTTFHGQTDVNARVSATIEGPLEVRIPPVSDPGPIVPVPVQAGAAGPNGPSVALIDVDGLILDQAPSGPYSAGENPVSAFREKLLAASADDQIRAVVVRINSPGGGVTACDIMAEELRRFREATGKPVVCCLMDLGTSGAYYLAVGGDRVVAHPTTITGGIGALLNHANLQDAMAQLNIRAEPIKSAPLVDMGSVTGPLPEEVESLLREMAEGFGARFRERVRSRRPAMTEQDQAAVADGRVVTGVRALDLHMVDRVGYLTDAIAEADRLSGGSRSQVVLLQRRGYPARSIYSSTPNVPIHAELIPLSYPGLDRVKVPTFLYLWEPDPTVLRLGGH
jgi:protease-4